MNKNMLILLIVLAVFILLYISTVTILPYWHKPIFNKTLQKICQDENGKTVGVWKDKEGSIKYFQSPSDPGNDEFVYLYDSLGNEIVRAGGFATIIENQKKYNELTKDLIKGKYGSCW